MTARRAIGCVLAALAVAAGCADDDGGGGDDRPAPSAPITVTAVILEDRVKVSRARFGAGPVRLLVSNQTGDPQTLTVATAGNDPGITATTAPIRPAATATLEADLTEGDYEVSTDRGVDPALLTVGPGRSAVPEEAVSP